VINYTSQGSVAAHVRCSKLFTYHITMHLSLSLFVPKIVKFVNTWLS